MFYLILTIMLVLFYIFVAPSHIKGTINVVVAAFVLVVLLTVLGLVFLKVLKLPSEIWLVLSLILIGLWAMRDIHFLDKPHKSTKNQKNQPHRRYKSLR